MGGWTCGEGEREREVREKRQKNGGEERARVEREGGR